MSIYLVLLLLGYLGDKSDSWLKLRDFPFHVSAALTGCFAGNSENKSFQKSAEFDYGLDSYLKMLAAISEAKERVSSYLNKTEVNDEDWKLKIGWKIIYFRCCKITREDGISNEFFLIILKVSENIKLRLGRSWCVSASAAIKVTNSFLAAERDLFLVIIINNQDKIF